MMTSDAAVPMAVMVMARTIWLASVRPVSQRKAIAAIPFMAINQDFRLYPRRGTKSEIKP